MLGRGSDSDGGSGRGRATPGEDLGGRGVDVRRWRRLSSRSAHQVSGSTASRSAGSARSDGSEVSCEMRARTVASAASGGDLVFGVGQPLRRVEGPAEGSEQAAGPRADGGRRPPRPRRAGGPPARWLRSRAAERAPGGRVRRGGGRSGRRRSTAAVGRRPGRPGARSAAGRWAWPAGRAARRPPSRPAARRPGPPPPAEAGAGRGRRARPARRRGRRHARRPSWRAACRGSGRSRR